MDTNEPHTLNTAPLQNFPDYSEMLVQLEGALSEMQDAFPRGQRARCDKAVEDAAKAVWGLQRWLYLKKTEW